MAVRRAHSEDDQESYFVSMTDLMIGLLFIFIIMLMSFAINYREAEEERQQHTETLEQTNQRLTDNRNTVAHILRELERSLEQQGIDVRVFPETGVLRLPENILFESGQAELSARGERAVGVLATALDPLIPCFARVDGFGWQGTGQVVCDDQHHGRLEAVLIEGHTDDRPIRGGRFLSNWELSTARAIATFAALERGAPMIGRAENDREEKLVGVSGYGEHRPVAENDDEAGRRANRRIDLRFLMAAPKATAGDHDG